MSIHSLQRLALVVTLSAFGARSAAADLIEWGPVYDVVAPPTLYGPANLVTAKNCDPSPTGPVSPTVDGVTFEAFTPPGWSDASAGLMAGSTSGGADFDVLLGGARSTGGPATASPTAWGAIRLDTLGALNPGYLYRITVWFGDQRTGDPAGPFNDRVMTLSSATGPALLSRGIVTNLASLTQGPVSGGLEADPNDVAGPGDTTFGQAVSGTFMRTTNDPLYLLVQGSHPVASAMLRPQVNALMIRELVTYVEYCSLQGRCPCNNDGNPGEGCANSTGVGGARLRGAGIPSASNDTFSVIVSGLPVASPGLLIQGGGNTYHVGFGDGLLCTPLSQSTRSQIQVASAGSTVFTDFLGQGFAAAGGGFGNSSTFQFWYRDPGVGPCGTGFNISNGLVVIWGP